MALLIKMIDWKKNNLHSCHCKTPLSCPITVRFDSACPFSCIVRFLVFLVLHLAITMTTMEATNNTGHIIFSCLFASLLTGFLLFSKKEGGNRSKGGKTSNEEACIVYHPGTVRLHFNGSYNPMLVLVKNMKNNSEFEWDRPIFYQLLCCKAERQQKPPK